MMMKLMCVAAFVVGAEAQRGSGRPSMQMTGPCGYQAYRSQMQGVYTACLSTAGGRRGWLKTCDAKCAAKMIPFWRNVSKCSSTTMPGRARSSQTLVNLHESCMGMGMNTNITSCSTASLFPFMVQCAAWTSNALGDGKIDASDHFCSSNCYQESQKFASCKGKGGPMFANMVKSLAAPSAACSKDPVGGGTTSGIESKLASSCQAVQVKTPSACSTPCVRTLLYTLRSPRYNTTTRSGATYKRLEPLVTFCATNSSKTACRSSKNMELNQVMQLCCGKGAKRCAQGMLPRNCSSVCSGAFLPYYSSCGRTVFKGNQLRRMVGFARTCGRQNGRWYSRSGSASGSGSGSGSSLLNKNDPCYKNSKSCRTCSGKCGWCRNEVRNKGLLRKFQAGGWCSSNCVTSKGECGLRGH